MTVYFLCYIAMICYLSCVASYYYCNMLKPRTTITHPRLVCFFLCLFIQSWSIPLVMSVGNEPSPIGDAVVHISVLLMPFLLFEGKILHKIIVYILLFITLAMVEAMTSSFQGVWFFFLGYGPAKSFYMIKDMPIAITISTATLLALGAFLFSRAVPVLSYNFRNYQPRTLCLLILPLITVPLVYNILAYMNLSLPVHSILYWVFCIPCYLFLYRGIRNVKVQEQRKSQQQNQLDIIKKQLDFSQHLENEYLNLRKWNHDISNHLLSLTYLMDNGRIQEAEEYCTSLILAGTSPNVTEITEDLSNEK